MAAEKGPQKPHSRSLVALDVLNFFLPDVQSGTGPFLAIYLLASLHWNPAQIGVAVSAATIAVVVAQTPAGALVDVLRQKRLMIALGAALISVGSLGIVRLHSSAWVVTFQAVAGASSSIFPPAVAAVSLGLVGRSGFARRLARNAA